MSLGLSGWFLWGCAPTVHAEDAYPYPNVPCIWAPHASAGTTAQWCPDYDWGYTPGDLSAANVISPYGYYYRNCTDYTAWKAASLGVPPALYRGLGDAKSWAVNAAAKGLRVDTTPAVGAVAVRTTGTYGHTAFVEAINPSGKLTVSQYNYRADGNYSQQTAMPVDLGFTTFIHFEAVMPVMAAAEVEPVAPTEPAAAALQATQAATLAETTPAAIINEEPPDEEPADLAVDSQLAAVASISEAMPPSESTVSEDAYTPSSVVVPNDSAPSPPTSPGWRQAAESPPLALAPAITQTATHANIPVMSGLDVWPLVGLAGVIMIREAAARRLMGKA